MLEFLASVDPLAVPVWGIFLLAAAMYPLGLMLGSTCSPWCDCDQCAVGKLPETVTVTFSNIPERIYWADVDFSACHGSGAIARVSETTDGQVSAVEVLDGGSGYAKLGRVAPSLTITGSGTGATFTPTLQAVTDACGVPSWMVASVAVSGGAGYANDEKLTIKVADGDTVTTQAIIKLQSPRSQPTLTASATGGTGATFTVTTTSNGGSPQTWGVSGVSVSGTTSGYADGASISFGYGAGVTEQTKAVATIRTARTVPTITARVFGGRGAALAVTLSQSPTTPSDTALWHVDGVSVTNGGTGYTHGDPVTFTVTDGTLITAATGTVVCGRENPNLTPYVWGFDGTTTGTGADLSATMTPSGDYWTVSSITINNGGSGYQVGEYLWYSEFPGFEDNPPYYLVAIDGYWITSVDGNGAITGIGFDPVWGGNGLFYKHSDSIASVTVTDGGDYYKATSTISRVVVTNPGAYYYYTGTPTSVTVQNGGVYYREEVSATPYVAAVTATVVDRRQYNQGVGAEVQAVIDSDTESATFGTITGVTITSGGAGYVPWEHNYDCCGQFYNNRSIVLRRPKVTLFGDGSELVEKCVYTHEVCSNIRYGNPTNEILVYYDGPLSPPRVRILPSSITSNPRQSEQKCYANFYADALVADCSEMSFTATDYRGATAVVVPGGEYDPEYANQDCNARGSLCCGWSGDVPQEIEVTVEDSPDGVQWGPPNGLAGVPTVVLSLAGVLGSQPIYGAVGYFLHGRDAIQWQGQVPGAYAYNGTTQNIAVRVQDCGEPSCVTSCSTTIRMQDTYMGIYAEQAESDPSSGCVAIPKCSPSPLTFVAAYYGRSRRVTIL